jgi:uncharacterized protein (DUF1501 family)
MAGGLLKKSQVHTDWPGLKRKEMYEGRDLNATIDARSVYASAMSTVFDLDFKRIKKMCFGEKIYKISLTSYSKLDEENLINYFYINIFNFSFCK